MNDQPTWERRAKGVIRAIFFLIAALGTVLPLALARQIPGVNPYFMPRFAYGILLRIMGLRVRVFGQCVEHPSTLYVANHTSYLDIPVLGSLIPGLFVAKSEVASWPFFGFMSRLYGTVYIERRAIRASTQKGVMRKKLDAGHSLILFPEGTSTDGLRTLAFKSSLFSIVEDPLPDGSVIEVQPVSVVFQGISGMPAGRSLRPYYAWFGDMTLLKHLWTAFCLGHYRVDVIFHLSRNIQNCHNRKELAQACQAAVAAGVSIALSGHIDEALPRLLSAPDQTA